MEVSEAIAARRSVRGFRADPVDPAVLHGIVTKAARAATGGNLQPWHIDVLTGDPLARLKAAVLHKLQWGQAETPAYDIYPKELVAPYRDRRFAVGEAMYAEIGIPREDKAGRRLWFARNFQFFGAPAGLFCTVDRRMGPPQWADLGMYLQNVMLLAVEAGLATCAQECWAMCPETVGDAIGIPPERMLFCGMAIGFEDTEEPANRLRSARAPEGEWLRIWD
ncbi:nitroreductase [Sphingomonas echinoides]|jgi:nitroreductase|uniref:Nitroreductase n=1 Tax=Sphingomonas echinoides TaxID=59803 RepID=A0ABU4PQG9_9SPHN|nr:nitroreductase [Sphingomonas echinoides]MDX5986057.1 nitroreductase [Sphingomonas echinoides]